MLESILEVLRIHELRPIEQLIMGGVPTKASYDAFFALSCKDAPGQKNWRKRLDDGRSRVVFHLILASIQEARSAKLDREISRLHSR